MSILALGLNHKTAPLEIRERLAFTPGQVEPALQALKTIDGIDEATIVSTCNRTEIYCRHTELVRPQIGNWLRDYRDLDSSEFDPYLFAYSDKEAVRHLLRVSCGLDSLVLGEPQILGQLKSAFHMARSAGVVGNQLNRLFQHAFSVAKQIRTDTEIGSSPVSVAFAGVRLAQQIFGELGQYKALLIGAGDTIELVLRHLNSQGIGQVTIANRTLERAHSLAEPSGARAVHIAAVPDELVHADIVVTATASNLPILGKGMVERALKLRKHQPMLLLDIAVPRDIEPQVGELNDVFLYTVDDLANVIEASYASRKQAATQAERIIETQADNFMSWLRSLDTLTTLKAHRQQAERLRDQVIEEAMRMLNNQKNPEEVIAYVGHTLTNKLLHPSTTRIRQAGIQGEDTLVAAAKELFDLKDESA